MFVLIEKFHCARCNKKGTDCRCPDLQSRMYQFNTILGIIAKYDAKIAELSMDCLFEPALRN